MRTATRTRPPWWARAPTPIRRASRARPGTGPGARGRFARPRAPHGASELLPEAAPAAASTPVAEAIVTATATRQQTHRNPVLRGRGVSQERYELPALPRGVTPGRRRWRPPHCLFSPRRPLQAAGPLRAFGTWPGRGAGGRGSELRAAGPADLGPAPAPAPRASLSSRMGQTGLGTVTWARAHDSGTASLVGVLAGPRDVRVLISEPRW